MPSPLYQQFQPQNQINPSEILAGMQQKYNVPANINDPNQVIQYLLSTGKVSQRQIDSIIQGMQNPMNPIIQRIQGMNRF